MPDPQFSQPEPVALDKHLSYRLSTDAYDSLQALCKRKGVTVGDAVREAIGAWYQDHKGDPSAPRKTTRKRTAVAPVA